jgi:hypothetical protein
MTLPSVTADQVSAALHKFDAELRTTPQWKDWQAKHTYRYALVSNGEIYPPKQIVAMATGEKLSAFSGGTETNNYLQERGFQIEGLHLPSESDTRIALHELLLEREPHEVSPTDAYELLARRFELTPRLREESMPGTGENHWENRVRFARRKLVTAEYLDGSERGLWRLTVRPAPRVWVEKTIVAGRPDRLTGEYALGAALWSPQRNRADNDDYWAMRAVQPGDFVVHLIDNHAIAGVSRVKNYVDTDFRGLPGTAWADVPGYLVRLTNYVVCDPPLARQSFLGNQALGPDFRRIRAEHQNLFYDRDLNLNQGFYLTPAPDDLVAILNKAYRSQAGRLLPHLEEYAPATGSLSTLPASPTSSTSHQRVWLYAPGRNAEHWEEYYREGILAIGWNEMGDLSELTSIKEVTDRLREIYERDNNPMNDALACYEFAHEMRPGDLVFAKRGRSQIVGYGTVLGDYKFDPTRDNYQHIRPIRWDGRGDWSSSDQTFVMKTLTDVTRFDALVSALKLLVGLDTGEEAVEVAPLQERTPYTIDDALDGLFLEKQELQHYLNIWRNKKNLIIQGPPGVGKTFVAKRLAYALMQFNDPSRLGMVQFHQSYGYEDFVQGYRPTAQGGLSLREGLFLEFCRRAARDLDATYVFVIDEINRGNLSRIFGELLMLIEGDKRGSAWSMPLMYADNSEAQFFVPKNVYLIGLMNTADRSLAMVDYALRRRFAFWSLQPQIAASAFRKHLQDKGLAVPVVERLISTIQDLNGAIAKDTSHLGLGYCIGHSYFCQEIPEGVEPAAWLRGVLETELFPLLDEYWADDLTSAEKWRSALGAIPE